jgi:predicted O-linked N-acetylglucosamine transferase (SPINDLY family)
LQVSYIGYLGTMGAPYIDYLIADRVLVPADHRGHYTEKIIYLPSFQANDAARVASARLFSREELGLPREGFVFCCLNNTYKISPETFDSWMRILRQVEDSVLFLYAENEIAPPNLRKEAAARGVDGGRLVFGGRLPADEYLARYRAVDLFLDTLPYNAGVTASDALWAGVPVLTCPGGTFAGRMAASLLTAVGMPELIAGTPQEYEAIAVRLATHPDALREVRAKLEAKRHGSLLFDTRRLARSIESAFVSIQERHLAGLPPDHVNVEA